MRHLFLVMLLATPFPALSQEVEAPPEIVVVDSDPSDTDATPSDTDIALPSAVDLDETVDGLVGAATSKNWILFAGLSLTLIVHLANKVGLKGRVGAAAVPWVTAGLGVLASVGGGLTAGAPVATAIMDGLLVGVTAIGGWEMLFKHILGRVDTSDPAPATE